MKPTIQVSTSRHGKFLVEVHELNIFAEFEDMKSATDFIKNLIDSGVL